MLTIREVIDKRFELLNVDDFIDVKFEDGKVIPMVGGSAVINSFVLSIIDRFGSKLPIKSDYSVTNFYVNNAPDGGSINKAFSRIGRDIVSEIGIHNTKLQELNDRFHTLVLDITNEIYNELETGMASGMYGISSFDIIEITKHPRIKLAKSKLKPTSTQKEIQTVYDEISKVIHSDDISHDNGLKKLFVSGIGNKNQIMQMIGLRGFCVEIDSSIFKYPITRSFAEGMNNLYYLGVESRTAAFALTASTESIKKSETLGRKLQIVGSFVRDVFPGDCGSTDYLEWYVEGPSDDYKGDLPNLVGAYYKETLLEKDLKIITENDKHLIGKKILLRNVTKCKLKDKHSVCSTCLGGLSHNIPFNANIGTLLSANMSQAASQALLSTKHHMGSAGTQSLVFDNDTLEIFDVNDKGVYSFKDSWLKKGANHTLHLTVDSVRPLMTIKDKKTISNISEEKLSRIEEMILWYNDEFGNEKFYTLNIKQNGRFGILSKKFIEYILENMSVEERSVVVKLDKLRSKNKVLFLENKSYSFFELVKEIESTIGKRRILKGGKSRETIDDLISKVFRLFNKKLNANIATVSVTLYPYMAKDLPNGNFDLARGSKDPQLISLDNAVGRRSLSGVLLYDGAHNKINVPASFVDKDKPSHLYDGLFKPNESIAEFNKRLEFKQKYLKI